MNEIEQAAVTLNECYPFMLSTVNGDKPATRPFGGVAPLGDKLVLLTEADKDVTRQIEKDPHVELMGIKEDYFTWIRVDGRAVISDSPEDKRVVLDYCPVLRAFFTDEYMPGLVAIVMEVDKIENYPQDIPLPDLSDRESLIFLVRHAETTGNRESIITGGDVDVELTEAGREMARKRADVFSGSNLKAVYASPLSRAQETAELLTEGTELEVVTDERLRERLLGELDNGPMFTAPDSIFYHDLPFSESPEDLFERVDEAIDEIGQSDGDVLVVSHGAALGNWLSRHTGNRNIAFDDNLCCAVIDGKSKEFIGIGFDDETLKSLLNRKL